jgi:hypothetical protein
MPTTIPKQLTSEQIKDKRIATLEFQLDAQKRENRANKETISEQASVIKRLNERGLSMMNRDSARYKMTEELRSENAELKKANEKLLILSKA